MKLLLINLKNLIPYLILICIYFFFINMEARKTQKNPSKHIDKESTINDTKLDINKVNQRISIPVFPYND